MKKLLLFIAFIGMLSIANAQNPLLSWAKSIGGSDYDSGSSIAVDGQGNVYTTGCFRYDTVDFDPGPGVYNLINPGNFDIFIMKQNASGDLVWAKQIGGIDSDLGRSICLDKQGNIYVTGYFKFTVDFDPDTGVYNLTTNSGNYNTFILKLDTAGNFVWADQLAGDIASDAYSVITDTLGNVYVTGLFIGTVDFDPGPGTYNLSSAGSSDIFIIKLNSPGDLIWAKQMGGIDLDYGYSVSIDTQSNVYATGYFKGTADFDPDTGVYNLSAVGNFDIFILKLNEAGDMLWAKQVGGIEMDVAYSICTDLQGNTYTTGRFKGTADFDPGSGIYNLITLGVWDLFVEKLDSSGNLLWAKQLGGNASKSGNSIITDRQGNVYLTGEFSDTTDFDPGPATYNLFSAGTDDVYVLKLNPAGDFVWAERLGGSGYDFGHSICIDNLDNVYLTGSFESIADFDPGSGVFNLSSNGSKDICIVKLSPDTITTFTNINQSLHAKLFPNPVTTELNLTIYADQNSNISWCIYDILGKEILKGKKEVHNGNTTLKIDLAALPKGLYLMNVVRNEERINYKVVKQ